MYVALEINCGFARAAIKHLTTNKRGSTARIVDKTKRATEFQELFSSAPNYGIPEGYFNPREKGRQSQFDRICDRILDVFNKARWCPTSDRQQYLNTFSPDKWKLLPHAEGGRHTMSECEECARRYAEYQEKFPLGPMYELAVVVSLPKEGSERQLTKQVFSEVDIAFQNRFGHSFAESLVKKCPKAQLQKRKTKAELKQARRKQQRQIRDHVSQQIAESAPLVTLSENESLAGYNRKRRAQYFESLPPSKKPKTHIPTLENISWDPDEVITDLQAVPEGDTINWSEIARKHGLQHKNGGQIVKELAKCRGLDVSKLDRRSAQPRSRVSRRKLPGGEISSPCSPTAKSLQESWKEMVSNGELTLGMPCAPYTIRKYITTKDGSVDVREDEVHGRKVSLFDVRKNILSKQEKFMRLKTDQEVEDMTHNDLKATLTKAGEEFCPDSPTPTLQKTLQELQRRRSLAIWHDHATILGKGYVLVTTKVLYDPAVFMTTEEYADKSGSEIPNLQQIIEEPEIHLLALCSSSQSDQLGLIPDRVDCLCELCLPITASNGVEVTDRLLFFLGDKPAQSFERGTQQGGYYKCGGCECPGSLMDDLAHALHCKWRSLTDLQQLVLAGKYGKRPGKLKPLEKLKTDELREELQVRQVFHTATTKKEHQQELTHILKGVQRVTTLLISNPSQPLTNLNLQDYTILDCEPLHTIKGHLRNMFDELPHVLPAKPKADLEDLLKVDGRDKITGADLRTTAIKAYLLLHRSPEVDHFVLLLLQTIVKISAMLYAEDSLRSPKMVLCLYNCTWLHHELCRHVFHTPKTLTREKLFGSYLHDLCVHAPEQYQIVSLRSINAECEERLFGQAKAIASQTSSRKPESTIVNIFLRLQAKQKSGKLRPAVQQQENQVSKAAKGLPEYTGTTISKQFISNRKSSWQAHLERICLYLVPGKGVWWNETEGTYHFHDGDEDPAYHLSGPPLFHYRHTTMKQLVTKKRDSWKQLIEKEVELPSPYIQLYNEQGMPSGVRSFQQSGTTLPIEPGTNPTSTPQDMSVPSENTSSIPIPSATLQSEDNNEDSEETAELIDVGDEFYHHESTMETNLDEETPQPSINDNGSSNSGVILKTTNATAISKVIGTTDDVVRLDVLRYDIRNGKRRDTHSLLEERALLAKLKALVLKTQGLINEGIAKMEHEYFSKHTTLLSRHESPQYLTLLKKRKYASALLRKWNIDF